MKNGEQVELVQENPARFEKSLPVMRRFLSQQKGIHYSSRVDRFSVEYVEEIFGTKSTTDLFGFSVK